MSRIVRVNLVLENCDDIVIPGEALTSCHIEKISLEGRACNPGWKSGSWFTETKTSDDVFVSCKKSFMDQEHYAFGETKNGNFKEGTHLERLLHFRDITQIGIDSEEDCVCWIPNIFCRRKPFRFVYKKVKKHFHYMVPWYYPDIETMDDFTNAKWTDEEGKEHLCEYANKYVKVEIDNSDPDDPEVKISIKRE